jgi:Arm DNA-binding domain
MLNDAARFPGSYKLNYERRSVMATIERYETKSGATLYRVRYRTPDNRSTQKRGFATKRDAQQWASTVEVNKMTGG